MKTAMIAGSTGLIGKELLQLLLHSDQYVSIIALTRSALSINHPKLRNILVDFKTLKELPSEIRPNDVFCCLGTTMAKAGSKEKFYEVDYGYPLKLAETTFRLGASKYLLVSSLGADKHSAVYYNKVKGDLEEALRSTSFKYIHVFRPSLLLGARSERRRGEEIGKVLFNTFSFLVPRRYKAIDSSKVALSMMHYASQTQEGFFIHESAEMQSK